MSTTTLASGCTASTSTDDGPRCPALAESGDFVCATALVPERRSWNRLHSGNEKSRPVEGAAEVACHPAGKSEAVGAIRSASAWSFAELTLCGATAAPDEPGAAAGRVEPGVAAGFVEPGVGGFVELGVAAELVEPAVEPDP